MAARPVFDDWFIYFPDDYRWSAALALMLGSAAYGGAELGEVTAVARELTEHVGDDDAWFRAWCQQADQLREAAARAASGGRPLTAASQYLRACGYYQIGERFRLPKDDLALEVYQRSVDCFAAHAALTGGPLDGGPRIERVEVPCEESALPAYLVLHGARDEQVPLADARALLAAAGSADKTLAVFDERTGGATHCQNDRLTAATAVWPDWFAARLALPDRQERG